MTARDIPTISTVNHGPVAQGVPPQSTAHRALGDSLVQLPGGAGSAIPGQRVPEDRDLQALAHRRIAVWGSSHSWEPFLQADGSTDPVYYGCGSSWISQISPELPLAPYDTDGTGSEAGERAVRSDASKLLLPALVRAQPDLVVLDVVDEQLPVMQVGHTWLTASAHLDRTPLGRRSRSAARATIASTDPARMGLFTAAVQQAVPWLLQNLPNATFVVHHVPAGLTTRGAALGPRWQGEVDAMQHALIAQLDTVFEGRLLHIRTPTTVTSEGMRAWFLAAMASIPPIRRSANGWMTRPAQALRRRLITPPAIELQIASSGHVHTQPINLPLV